ncbi:hypothetical protein [Senegalia massiliensis]|uniref:hypothetical protein n=1 Tax=Senegalia massiliensis TaxID=1720316 RepID=UPI0013EF178A|nr:hypothetical protein [Senegalia massiliensis]
MEDTKNDLVELTKEFIEFSDKLYLEKKIDKETYIQITKRKKGFLRCIEKDRMCK